MKIHNRYKKNFGIMFDEELQQKCLNKTIAIIGLGGCGGYILEHFIRLGVKRIFAFDGDKFEETNLNRQRFCNSETLNKNKASAAFELAKKINSEIPLFFIEDFFSEKYLNLIFENNIDLVIYAADYYTNLIELNKAITKCLIHNIPIIKVGIGETSIIAQFIERKHPHMWIEAKVAAINQVNEGPCTTIACLSHYCALSACLVLELFLSFIKNPKLESCSLIYDLKRRNLYERPCLEP